MEKSLLSWCTVFLTMPSSTNEKTGTHGSCQKAAASCSSNLDANLVSLWHSAHQLSRLVLVKCDLTLSPSGDWPSNCVAQIFFHFSMLSNSLQPQLPMETNSPSSSFPVRMCFLTSSILDNKALMLATFITPQAFLQLLLPLWTNVSFRPVCLHGCHLTPRLCWGLPSFCSLPVPQESAQRVEACLQPCGAPTHPHQNLVASALAW